MALTDAELARLKAELGYNLIGIAQPYINVVAIFEGVIQPYLGSGASTTSATAVTATTPPSPAAVALTLASATGFHAFDRVVVDVDDAQETATVASVSGSTITVRLQKAHSGTYPVLVEGGESIVRELLSRIREVKAEMAETFGEGSIRKVDEVEFYQTGGTAFGNLGGQLWSWREELAAVLGIPSMWAQKRQGAQRLSAY